MGASPRLRLDGDAKEALRSIWPKAPTKLLPHRENRRWVRAQPALNAGATHPRLVSPGSERLKTQPDGLYCQFGSANQFVDVLAIEVCSSEQNINDKRARYAPTTSALCLEVGHSWLLQPLTKKKAVWEYIKTFEVEPPGSMLVPIRHLSLLVVVKNDVFKAIQSSIVPSGHEFFMPVSAIKSPTAAPMRQFLSQMTRESHFYGSVRVRQFVAGSAEEIADAPAEVGVLRP